MRGRERGWRCCRRYTYSHGIGRALIHLGRQRHGADDITSGERMNLICWSHSSTYRESDEYNKTHYHKEGSQPDQVQAPQPASF